jgi:glycerol uptake facilitator-like aquaporin
VTPTEWVLTAVLVVVPFVLLVSRRFRRHAAVLVIIWLIALIGLLFVAERLSVDCAVRGFLGC